MNEFEIIRTYFLRQSVARDDVVLGIGDDAAVLAPPPGRQLVVSTDTLIEGVHFPAATEPAAIGHKALAVNLSDLAAMGAEPAWFTLNLTLPRDDEGWLGEFSRGLFDLACAHRIQLVGGDTTCGPLSISITVHGFVPPGAVLARAGARPGDRIYVTGELGDAGLALAALRREIALSQSQLAAVRERLDRPQPRVAAGLALRGVATACIDISDGLMADLGHVLAASRVGARIELPLLPLSPAVRTHLAQTGWDTVLGAGDDYELCFTVPPGREPALRAAASRFGCPVSPIGEIESGSGLRVLDASGAPYRPVRSGYDHFGAR